MKRRNGIFQSDSNLSWYPKKHCYHVPPAVFVIHLKAENWVKNYF